jgi:hypothetical protein
MSKKASGRKQSPAMRRRRASAFAAVCLLLPLISAAVAAALSGAGTPSQGLSTSPAAAPLQTQGSFSPSSPAKEYVYAGGRLVATEEPTLMPPAAPSGLQGQHPSSSSCLLSWTDNANNESGFKVERQQYVNGVLQWAEYSKPGPDVTSLKVSSGWLSYRVRSLNAVGESAPSNAAPCGWLTYNSGGSLFAENVYWTNVVGVQATGNSLRKVSGGNSWDSGAVSTRSIASGGGYAEFTPGNASTWRAVGLGNGDSSRSFTDIEFGFYLAGSGSPLHIYEAGIDRGAFGAYASTDRLRVSVDGGAVRYYRNGELLYQSAVQAAYPLHVDTALNTINSQAENAVIAATSFRGVSAPENVYWTHVAPTVRVTGNSLQKVSGGNYWGDAGAASSRTIASGDGYVEFTPGETQTFRILGLNSGNPTWHYSDIEHGFYLAGGGSLHVYESPQRWTTVGTYTAADRLRVAVEGNKVRYYKNGAMVYESPTVPSYPLAVDTSLNTVNASVHNVVVAAEFYGGTPAPENVAWTDVTSTLQVTGNSLQKVSGSNSWYDGGAVSTRAIASGDGYVEFTPGHTGTWRLCGLGTGNTGTHYSDVEFGFFLGGGGDLHVFEAGQSRGRFGTYGANDRLRVAVEGGRVRYYKNGALLYENAAPTLTYPLLVDTSFNTVNAGLYNVQFAGALTP